MLSDKLEEKKYTQCGSTPPKILRRYFGQSTSGIVSKSSVSLQLLKRPQYSFFAFYFILETGEPNNVKFYS